MTPPPHLLIQNATPLGYLIGHEGDGVVINFPSRARGRVQAGKSPTIYANGQNQGVITMAEEEKKLTIRKLTERECMRLQGFSDEEIDRLMEAVDEKGKRKYPKTAIYRFAGNAVCVAAFVRITEQILDDMEGEPIRKAVQTDLGAWM